MQREVGDSIDLLRSKNAELESMLDYLRAQPEKIDVDEAVTATSPIYNQLSERVLLFPGWFLEWVVFYHPLSLFPSLSVLFPPSFPP
jgi:hypothetical protein